MNARVVSTAVAVALLFASQASASVISASSQTARSKPADKVDYLSVTTMQNDLNASMREVADAVAPTALGSKSLPSTTSGGFLLNSEPSQGGSALESLFIPEPEKAGEIISTGFASGPGTVIANGSSHGGRWGSRRGGWNRRGGHDRWLGGGGGGGGGRHYGGGGGGVQAAPEPSTWLLLGVGLSMVGVLEVVRRRV